ncbi:MAG: AGE family epimerase/isomerase, partial [Caulobacterales bacterium]|nr:AGE family epimerase/isomerase [Caulobacterales bacterium]
FNADWTPAAGEAGRIVEPGHQLEWAFLLSRFEQIAGEDLGDEITRLVAHAEAYGLNRRTGLVIDEAKRDGVPLRTSARCWVQTEALRAALVMRERGHPHAEDRAVDIIDTIMNRYLNVDPVGSWIDQFDAEGAPIFAKTPAPASTLYHLIGAIAACEEAVK